VGGCIEATNGMSTVEYSVVWSYIPAAATARVEREIPPGGAA